MLSNDGHNHDDDEENLSLLLFYCVHIHIDSMASNNESEEDGDDKIDGNHLLVILKLKNNKTFFPDEMSRERAREKDVRFGRSSHKRELQRSQ